MKNAFDELHVAVTWCMHEETHLLNRIREIWPSECKVLESSSKAAVESGIGQEGPITSGQFGLSVDGGGDRLAVEHVSTVENFECILLLTQEEARGVGSDVNAQEMVKVTEIGHGELVFEGMDDTIECLGCAGGEDDIIHID